MKIQHYFFILFLFASFNFSQGQAPQWWVDNEVLDTAKERNDFGIANIGQAKYLFLESYKELNTKLSNVGGAGEEIEAIVQASWFKDPSKDFAPAVNGQVKYMAKAIYDRIAFFKYNLHPLTNGSTYPWSSVQDDDKDTAITNIGQLKYLYSFDLGQDSDSDGILDYWESYYFSSTAHKASDDNDSDGYSNFDEYRLGQSPIAFNEGGIIEPPVVKPPVFERTIIENSGKILQRKDYLLKISGNKGSNIDTIHLTIDDEPITIASKYYSNISVDNVALAKVYATLRSNQYYLGISLKKPKGKTTTITIKDGEAIRSNTISIRKRSKSRR